MPTVCIKQANHFVNFGLGALYLMDARYECNHFVACKIGPHMTGDFTMMPTTYVFISN